MSQNEKPICLTEDEVAIVTGGGRSGGGSRSGSDPSYEDWERMAKSALSSPVYVPFPCPYCSAVSSGGRYSVWAHYYSDYHNEYRFAACFACGRKDMHIINGQINE